MARRWTLDEDDRLRQLYRGGAPLAEMGRALGRSPDAIAARRAAIGLAPRRSTRPWSALEDEIIKAADRAGLPATTLARRLRRPVEQVRARRRQLSVARPQGRRYTAADDARLRAGWASGADIHTLARELGRSPDALRVHAKQLGLHRPTPRRRWQAHEDALVRDGYTDGLTCAEIAAALPERTATAVAARARKLGLVTYARRWTREDDARLAGILAFHSIDEAAELLGRTPEAIRRHTRKLGLTPSRPAPAPRAGRRWTTHEDERLRLHAALNPAVLARLLGRSDHAIVARLRRLGLRSGRQRSPHHPSRAIHRATSGLVRGRGRRGVPVADR